MARGGRYRPPRVRIVSVRPTATSTSATQEYQRTRRPPIRSTRGAISSTSPRISNCIKGMLTPLNVKDSGTVNSSNAVPSPEANVQRVGQGTDRPRIVV